MHSSDHCVHAHRKDVDIHGRALVTADKARRLPLDNFENDDHTVDCRYPVGKGSCPAEDELQD